MKEYFHSVTLDNDKCRGFTNCIKHCPTEAIRVRGSKAVIINERCIDCGECIRVCPYHAKQAVADKLEDINKFKYKIALPAPSLYGQYDYTRRRILAGLLKLGFDMIYEWRRVRNCYIRHEYAVRQTGAYNTLSSLCLPAWLN